MKSDKFVYKRIAQDDAIVCFIDHQAGLVSLVQDFSPEEFRNSIFALADIATLYNLPTILTTSFEQGPNGPMLPQLKEMFPKSPYIARPGEINAWDNKDFVQAVKETKRKQIIMAGIVTEVCVVFPALSALEQGYEVFIATDACGTFNDAARYAAWNRMSQAGAQLMNWFSISGELQRDWRDKGQEYGKILSKRLAMYATLMMSYDAQKK